MFPPPLPRFIFFFQYLRKFRTEIEQNVRYDFEAMRVDPDVTGGHNQVLHSLLKVYLYKDNVQSELNIHGHSPPFHSQEKN